MKRFATLLGAVLAMVAASSVARADASSLHYGGYQPWWNIFAHRPKCMTPEEQRLQRFWHDYYDALRHYYQSLDHIDWVAYYKNHGYQINGGGMGGAYGCAYGQCGGPQRIQFAPVFVSPQMQWAVPNGCMTGAPQMPMGYGQ